MAGNRLQHAFVKDIGTYEEWLYELFMHGKGVRKTGARIDLKKKYYLVKNRRKTEKRR